MDTLLNTRPDRQHPISTPTISVPHACSWPLSCPCQHQKQKATNRRPKKNTAQNERYLSGIDRLFKFLSIANQHPKHVRALCIQLCIPVGKRQEGRRGHDQAPVTLLSLTHLGMDEERRPSEAKARGA
ncbi:MAG TPA: hypothetical protein VF043_12445 [Ktedonobacteraceae bacterium]